MAGFSQTTHGQMDTSTQMQETEQRTSSQADTYPELTPLDSRVGGLTIHCTGSDYCPNPCKAGISIAIL